MKFNSIVQVYDGTSKQSPKIAEICSNKHPPAILSEGHALTIAFEEIEDKDFAFTFDLKAYYTVLDNGKSIEFSNLAHLMNNLFVHLLQIAVVYFNQFMVKSVRILTKLFLARISRKF